jgi:RHS repeat-associated protein
MVKTYSCATDTEVKTTDYVGNKVYENGALKRILVDGGYIENGVYHYYVTDHLGNNRIVANSSGTVVQSTQYYPFGMSFADAAGAGAQPYKYNGKELDQMHGLNMYDYSARHYDSAIGRFTTVDPLAEKYYSISPYVYCNNNPIKYIDPTGMYFDPVNEKAAQNLEKDLDKKISKLNKEISKLQAKGKEIGDRADRVTELTQSKTDISDMRNNSETEFRYAKASDKNNPAGKGNPVTSPTGSNDAGHNVVTMYTEGNMGNQIHESRHGGQVARGEYSFDQRGNPTAGYGVGSEVSAYRAQYSYDGKLNYIDASSALNQQLGSTGITPPASTVTGILTITPDFVRTKIGEVRSTVVRGNRVYGLVPIYGRLP